MLVQGVGAVGLSTIALAKIAGASWVGAIGDPAERRTLATAMGADRFSRSRARQTPSAGRRCSPRQRSEVRTSSSRRLAPPARSRKGSSSFATAASTSSPATTPTLDRVSSTPTAHINRKHLDVRGCWGSEARHFLLAHDAAGRAMRPACRGRRIGDATFGLDGLNRRRRSGPKRSNSRRPSSAQTAELSGVPVAAEPGFGRWTALSEYGTGRSTDAQTGVNHRCEIAPSNTVETVCSLSVAVWHGLWLSVGEHGRYRSPGIGDPEEEAQAHRLRRGGAFGDRTD